MWPFSQRETRASTNYTEAVIAQLVQGEGGDTDIPSHTTAAEEIAVGLWGRAFASATVTPDTPATRGLTPEVLGQLGRDLCAVGEAIFEIGVRQGQVFLERAAACDIEGVGEWTYRVQLAHPSGLILKTLPASRVVHVRYASDPEQPWRGLGPIQKAQTTLRLGERMEARLSDESGTRVGYLIPVPKVDDTLQGDINKLKGKSVLVASTSGGWDQGQAPKGDFEPRRLGFDPPTTIDPLRDGVSRSILAACGIPTALLGRADGTLLRESYRQFVHATVAPTTKLIIGELRNKLDTPDLALGFDELGAADVAGRARAFNSLIQGGMSTEDAARVTGLIAVED